MAGAVILAAPIDGLADSKQLSRKCREQLAPRIYEQALSWGLGWVAAAEVDALGMTASVRLAFERALQALGTTYGELVIDGSYNFFPADARARAVVKADVTVPAVSAASIIAKVARDDYMRRAAVCFGGYGFEQHVGYGTAIHAAALRKLGACELHRRSFRPVHTLGLTP